MADAGGFSERFAASLKAADGAAQTDFFEPTPKYRGLVIRVARSGLKTWCFMYTWGGKRTRMTLGPYPAVTVAEAHKRAIEARSYLSEQPPRDPRREMTDPSDAGMTVANLVTFYLEKRVHAKVRRKSDGGIEDGLRNAPKIMGILNRNVVPLIGGVRLADLHTRDLNRVVDVVLARGSPVAAARTFQVMRAMLRWAVSRGDLDRSPMDHMERPSDSAARERTLSDEEIRTFWRDLHKAFPCPTIQRVLKLQLVIGQRVGEVCGMAQAELDVERRLWTIPAERSKNKHVHELPLPPLALEIIDEALAEAGNSAFVFPNPKTGLPFSSTTISSAVVGAHTKIGIDHFTSHDLRRTCADGMDSLGVLDGIVGRVLNHRSVFKATVTQRHYITRSYQREMRDALELWENRLRAIIGGQPVAEVIPLRM